MNLRVLNKIKYGLENGGEMGIDWIIKGLVTITNILLVITLLLFTSIVLLSFNIAGINLETEWLSKFIDTYKASEEFLPSVITILTLVISVALPLSVQLVSKPDDKRFAQDISLMLFEEPMFKKMKLLILILIGLMALFFFGGVDIVTSLIALGITIYSLILFRGFLNLLIKYITDFTNVIKQKAQSELDEII